jgi:glycosyltransferase involved in cell wall biosynthesis
MPNTTISFLFNEATPYHNILLKGMRDADASLTIYYLYKKWALHPWDIERESQALGRVFYIDNLLQVFTKIGKHLVADKPDCMVVAGYRDVRNLITFLLLKLRKVRFAFWSDTPNLEKERSQIRRSIRSMGLSWLFRHAEAIFATGQVGVEAYNSLGCPANKLKNLPYTIDLEAPHKLSTNAKAYAATLRENLRLEGTLVFLAAGQLIERKRYDVALRAFAQALPASPEGKAVILIAGEGPEKQALADLASSLGLASQVHFLGWVQPGEMAGVFEVADVLLHPAAYEPYGLVVLEAMAWGLPVLASHRTMAAVDQVRHGENGFIHQMGEVEELAQHISYFLEDPQRAREMGAKARQTVEEWPVSRIVQTILDVI